MSNFSVYPYSRGHIHITGPGLDDVLDFTTGFLSDPEGIDIKKHVWAYKKQREVLRRMTTFRGEVPSGHPAFPPDSKAVCGDADGPVTDDKEIEYSAEDDALIEDFLLKNVATTWHSIGTCKMAPRENMGVVDPSLSVYGVEGLKLADLSIPPRNVACNTNNVALTIGEKAADIFIKELGLSTE
jgi:choline dehydrogenase-like flavoprotein